MMIVESFMIKKFEMLFVDVKILAYLKERITGLTKDNNNNNNDNNNCLSDVKNLFAIFLP